VIFILISIIEIFIPILKSPLSTYYIYQIPLFIIPHLVGILFYLNAIYDIKKIQIIRAITYSVAGLITFTIVIIFIVIGPFDPSVYTTPLLGYYIPFIPYVAIWILTGILFKYRNTLKCERCGNILDKMIKCHKCGIKICEKCLFCPECDKEVEIKEKKFCPRCEREVEIIVKRHIGGSYSKYEVCSICGKKLKESTWHQFETCIWAIVCIVTIVVAIFIGMAGVL